MLSDNGTAGIIDWRDRLGELSGAEQDDIDWRDRLGELSGAEQDDVGFVWVYCQSVLTKEDA